MLLQETVIEIDDDRLPRTEGGCNLNTIAVYSSILVHSQCCQFQSWTTLQLKFLLFMKTMSDPCNVTV